MALVRVRHRLNDRLLQSGGHIGYYIRVSERGKGYGKAALRLALEELRQLGGTQALLTVHSDNAASRAIVLAQGGVLENQVKDPANGLLIERYWIELTGSPPQKAVSSCRATDSLTTG